MKLTYGHTRFVILVGDKAIKIVRFKLLNLLLRLLILPFSKRRREHWFSKYGSTFGSAIWNDWWSGLLANQQEFNYYDVSRDPLVIPTLKILFGGFIIIQERGTPLSEEEFRNRPTLFQMICDKESELHSPTQYARNKNGHVVIVDYGWHLTVESLKKLPCR